MFHPIRLLIRIALSIIVILVILYFLPPNLKAKILNFVDSITSPSSHERDVLIQQLEENLDSLRGAITADSTIKKMIEESQRILSDLKASLEK